MKLYTILTAILVSTLACNGPIQSPGGGHTIPPPDATDTPPTVQDVATGVDTPPDPAEFEADKADTGTDYELDSTHAPTLAEAFDAAGGLDLCRAAVYALSPELNPAVCEGLAEDRRDRCREQREPLQTFVQTVCTTVLDESKRLDLDPLLVLAVIERESSMGRVQFDTSKASYEVETDICSWFLSKTRIRTREPGRREGTERISWVYGDDQRVNTQQVRVLEETDEGLRIDTCVAGEAGIMQTIPREWRSGTVVEATGDRLTGSTAQRRAQVISDPELQVRLGCQALAEHRDLCPETLRGAWTSWIFSYNLGKCDPTSSKAHEYLGKIRRHYLDACEGYVPDESGLPKLIRDLWPECERVANS